MHYMSGDETAPGLPFIRLVNPTDFDKTLSKMVELYNAQYPGIAWSDLFGWGMSDWLKHVIDLSREWKTGIVDSASAGTFNAAIFARYPKANPEQMQKYAEAYLLALAASAVPASVQKPWSYTPTEVGDGIALGSKAVVKSMTPLILGAVAVYALVSAFLPNLISKVARR